MRSHNQVQITIPAPRSGLAVMPTLIEILLIGCILCGVVFAIGLLLDPSYGSSTHSRKGSSQPIRRMVVTSDGQHLWLQKGTTEVIQTDLRNGQSKSIYQWLNRRILNTCVSDDSRVFFLSILESEVLLYRDGELVIAEQLIDNAPRISLSANGQTAICISMGTAASCWNLSGAEPVHSEFKLQESAERIALNPLGTKLIVSCTGSGLMEYDVKTGVLERTFPDSVPNSRELVFSSDGCWLAAASEEILALIDVATGAPRWVTHASVSDNYLAIAISPDGNWVSAGSLAAGVQILAGTNGICCQRFAPESHCSRLAFSPGSDVLFAGSTDGSIVVWSLRAGKELTRLHPFEKNETGRELLR